MRKILFMLNPRSGTNLWKFLAGKPKVNFFASPATQKAVGGVPFSTPIDYPSAPTLGNWTGTKESFFLSVIPGGSVPCDTRVTVSIEEVLKNPPNVNTFSWFTPVGAWWGQVPSDEIPEPYEGESYTRFGPAELASLPGDDWEFACIIRDGRNQIESFRNLPGGIEQKRHKEDPKDYFKFLCKTFRNRARVTLDSLDSMPNFHLVYFESLASEPSQTMQSLYKDIGLTPNKNYLDIAQAFLEEKRPDKQHSSFGGKEGSSERWHCWTEWEKDTFKEIAGQELQELGYVLHDNW